jgi:hypothetical protein
MADKKCKFNENSTECQKCKAYNHCYGCIEDAKIFTEKTKG